MNKTSSDKKLPLKKLILILIGILILVVIITGGFFFYQYQQKQNLLKNPKIASVNEANALVVKIGKLIKLPNETPSVATISDIEKLKDQSLFKNAQNGDKVLIFSQSKKAIVYRPSENVLIEVGNLVINPNRSSSSGQLQSTDEKGSEIVKVSFYNGTKTAGLAKTEAKNIETKFSNIEIVDTKNAASDYQKTVVIDLSGK